ncbi:MAG: nucleotidyltransferase [Planctomycetota bacterium]
MPDLDNLIARLIQNEVDLVVVGGFAATTHGVTLVTQDVDVCCDFSPDNLMRLQAALSDLHPVHRMPPARPPLELAPESAGDFKNLYLDTDYGQLDCLSSIDGIGDFEQARQHSIEITLPEGTCRILSLDALIRSKEAMNRPRDREAVLQLKAIREQLDGQP